MVRAVGWACIRRACGLYKTGLCSTMALVRAWRGGVCIGRSPAAPPTPSSAQAAWSSPSRCTAAADTRVSPDQAPWVAGNLSAASGPQLQSALDDNGVQTTNATVLFSGTRPVAYAAIDKQPSGTDSGTESSADGSGDVQDAWYSSSSLSSGEYVAIAVAVVAGVVAVGGECGSGGGSCREIRACAPWAMCRTVQAMA